eukprot:502649_1
MYFVFLYDTGRIQSFEESGFATMNHKKPLMLGAQDSEIREYVLSLRDRGTPVSGPLLSAIIAGVLSATCPNKLVANNGHIDPCSPSLIQSCFRRWGMVSRRATNGRVRDPLLVNRKRFSLLRNIIKPYVDKVRIDNGYGEDIPAGYTDELQPLDLSANKPFKRSLRKQFVRWYAGEVKSQLDSGLPLRSVGVDMTWSSLKNKHAGWIVSAYNDLAANKAALIKGWKMLGLNREDVDVEEEEKKEEVDVIASAVDLLDVGNGDVGDVNGINGIVGDVNGVNGVNGDIDVENGNEDNDVDMLNDPQ